MSQVGRILFADDAVEFRQPMSRVLEREGFEVTCVGDVGEALACLGRHEFDVVITDIYMPGNHELQLVREIRASTPVIVVTAAPSVPTAVSALRWAAFDYLVKPVDPNTLVERTRAAVEKAQAMREIRASRAHLASMARGLESLEVVLSGRGDGGDDSTTTPAPRGPLDGLTTSERESLSPRELEVLEALARGQRVNEVATTLFISPHTVRNHLKSVFRKLGVRSQVELLAKLSGANR